MGGTSLPNGLSGVWQGGGSSTGSGTGAAKTPLVMQQGPTPSPTPQPGVVAAGMGATGIPDYISNWLAQGGKGTNPLDPTNVAAVTNSVDVAGIEGPASLNTHTGPHGHSIPMKQKTTTAAAGSLTPPAFSPSVQRAASSVNGATPGAPSAPGAAPGATPGPGASIYDARYGTAPTIQSQITSRFGVGAPPPGSPGNQYQAPSQQDLEGITDQQLTSWLQQGGGNDGVRAILGPEQAWMSQGKYADPASMRAYAMWRLGMGNGMAASSAYKAPQQQQPRWGS